MSAWAQLGPGFVRGNVAVDGATISYVVRDAPGPALLLIPGSFNGADVYAGVVAGLNPKLKVMIVELRGHGKSWPPPVHGTIPEFTQDVLAAANHAGVGRFYIGGHSIGGMIAIEAAKEYPQRLKGVIAIEGWTHYSVAKDAFHGQIRNTLTAAQLARVEELRKPVMSRWTHEQVTEFAHIWRHWNGYGILERTNLPVLELWGDRGRPHPSRRLMKIPDRPNIELKWFHGACHPLLVQRPAGVAQAINAFVARTNR